MEDGLDNMDKDFFTKGAFNGKYWNTLSLEAKNNFIYGLLQAEIVDSQEQPFAKTISEFMSSELKRDKFIGLIDGFYRDKNNQNASIVAICRFICFISEYNKFGVNTLELRNKLEDIYNQMIKHQNLVKDVERFNELSKLLQENKFIEGSKILEELEQNGFISPEALKPVIHFCFCGRIVLLYGETLEYLNNKEYAKAVQLLEGMKSFIIANHNNLGIEKQQLQSYVEKMKAGLMASKAPTIETNEIKIIRENAKKLSHEMLGDSPQGMVLEIFYNSMLTPMMLRRAYNIK